jgi:hypothetical protein
MRIAEVTNPLHTYTAVVRVRVAGGSASIRTLVQAGSMLQARMLLLHVYGPGNVLSVV